jgi:hypothetical protein
MKRTLDQADFHNCQCGCEHNYIQDEDSHVTIWEKHQFNEYVQTMLVLYTPHVPTLMCDRYFNPSTYESGLMAQKKYFSLFWRYLFTLIQDGQLSLNKLDKDFFEEHCERKIKRIIKTIKL